MQIILSTRNPSKAEQIKDVFKGSEIEVLTLDEAGIEGEGIEDGATLKDNALKKARYAWEKAGGKSWVMADDTGIFIKALNGEPGVRSARWAGEGIPTEEITKYCLTRLEGILDRSAFFETVVAVIDPSGREYFFNGTAEGRILEEPRTKPQPKMPYSHIFVPNDHALSWAEMTVEEENAISHRGKAFRGALDFLRENLNN